MAAEYLSYFKFMPTDGNFVNELAYEIEFLANEWGAEWIEKLI